MVAAVGHMSFVMLMISSLLNTCRSLIRKRGLGVLLGRDAAGCHLSTAPTHQVLLLMSLLLMLLLCFRCCFNQTHLLPQDRKSVIDHVDHCNLILLVKTKT